MVPEQSSASNVIPSAPLYPVISSAATSHISHKQTCGSLPSPTIYGATCQKTRQDFVKKVFALLGLQVGVKALGLTLPTKMQIQSEYSYLYFQLFHAALWSICTFYAIETYEISGEVTRMTCFTSLVITLALMILLSVFPSALQQYPWNFVIV